MPLRILDTDIITLFLNGHEQITRKIASAEVGETATTIITVDESLTGWYSQVRKAKNDARLLEVYSALQNVAEVVGVMRILPFDADALAIARRLRAADRRIGVNDLRIAAIVINHSGILITRNRRDFSRFKELSIEEW